MSQNVFKSVNGYSILNLSLLFKVSENIMFIIFVFLGMVQLNANVRDSVLARPNLLSFLSPALTVQ
jgi:hypothetical protein